MNGVFLNSYTAGCPCILIECQVVLVRVFTSFRCILLDHSLLLVNPKGPILSSVPYPFLTEKLRVRYPCEREEENSAQAHAVLDCLKVVGFTLYRAGISLLGPPLLLLLSFFSNSFSASPSSLASLLLFSPPSPSSSKSRNPRR